MAEVIEDFHSEPVGRIGLIALPGCEELAKKIDAYLIGWQKDANTVTTEDPAEAPEKEISYLVNMSVERFSTGEAKVIIKQTVRGRDLFILCDMFNYGVTYRMYERDIPTSPDAHYANLKRVISAIAGKAKRITVIMPMLYEGRQTKRNSRESLDCANALQELCSFMGVHNILTFDAHDPVVQNAIPLYGFENVKPTYQMIKSIVNHIDDLNMDRGHLMIVSPDEGGMDRGIYYSTVLQVELGMFYKLIAYLSAENGVCSVRGNEFLGGDVAGKDIIIVDDMISLGENLVDVAKKLKESGAKRIFICAAFGLFCNGLKHFDRAYEDGLIDKVFTTNLIYRSPELLKREWYVEVDLSKYISLLVGTLNHDVSVGQLLNPAGRIKKLLIERGLRK
ncbi:MAG: ribose-phosphate pyrophosphokinase [Clostridiales bacterium]|nr:ribose-phosphate pyrophosphokinase [Clostridiales bacterium]